MAARRLGAALRLVIGAMVATEAPAKALAAVAEQVEVRFVGTLDDIEGRKIRTRRELWVGDGCTAEAEGVFITVGRDHFPRAAPRNLGPPLP